jgi:hypothetical protein
VWIRPAVKPDGFKYYKMLLVYVDDVLCISHDLETTMKCIQGTFKLKKDKIEVPTNYLDVQIYKKMINGISFWTMSLEQYIKAATIANVETKLDKDGQQLPSRCLTPMKSGYRPKVDVSSELKLDGIRYLQELISILRWVCELGRVNIVTEVSLLLSHLALPRERTLTTGLSHLWLSQGQQAQENSCV